ncbi:MAG TPA: FRG domain-containing protein [Bradyrhizobium sp.]|jgi:hypothetical protein|uniref:FRG domain-containing protein n=1 Tax=Bradyrhizobium sp. TaxID=376 RepID=UPI002CB38643|nr:FRG domain-containing protein [Bradyrhizobium sp.]HTB00274.1 FRG domain-containing protein [Bradyrhizobium sp.]
MTWNQAADEWSGFLGKINLTREELRCSWNSPWFRGHTNSADYKLLPGILRNQTERDKSRIRRVSAQIENFERTIAECKVEITKIRKTLTVEHNLWKADPTPENERRVKAAQKILDEKRLKMGRARNAANNAQLQIDKINLVPTGEREAFIEFSARSGQQFTNSWEVLAAMQHCGVPTRLLDWTETLASALFFSLRKFSLSIDVVWARDKKDGRVGPFQRTPTELLTEIGPLPTPSVWVLNPFRASAKSTDRTRIWDISRQPEYDYFQRIVVERNWDFEGPIPAFSPWRSARMAAQQGTFVVWGRDRRPLNEILGSDFVAEVLLSERAAIYGVYMLKHMLAIDHFSLFRDLDSLSAAIADRYIK